MKNLMLFTAAMTILISVSMRIALQYRASLWLCQMTMCYVAYELAEFNTKLAVSMFNH